MKRTLLILSLTLVLAGCGLQERFSFLNFGGEESVPPGTSGEMPQDGGEVVQEAPQEKTALNVLKSGGSFSKFVSAVEANPAAVEAFTTGANKTFFIPTNAAMAKIDDTFSISPDAVLN